MRRNTMWHTNKSVTAVYAHTNTQFGHAIIDGLPGWKRIKPASTDGVTNVLDLLSAAKAEGQMVNVYLDGDDHITAAYM